MKTKREIKVGDMVWWKPSFSEPIKCRVDQMPNPPTGYIYLIDGDDGGRTALLSDCKLIIPRKKKAKKDRKVKMTVSLLPEVARRAAAFAKERGYRPNMAIAFAAKSFFNVL